MTQDYTKTYYNHVAGYRLHHTIGASAEASTLPYLHCNTSLLLCCLSAKANAKSNTTEYRKLSVVCRLHLSTFQFLLLVSMVLLVI